MAVHYTQATPGQKKKKKKILCQGIINENILNTAKQLTAQSLNLLEMMQYFPPADWICGELGLFGALPGAADEKGTDRTTLWWVIADLINRVTKSWSQTNKEEKFKCFVMNTNWRRFVFWFLFPIY